MTQDEVKIVCRRATLWKTDIFLRGRVQLFTGGWVSFCWVPKRDDAGWSEKCMPRCNALKNGHLPERKGWALYRRVGELLLSSKERWRRMKWKLYAEVQRPGKRASSWEEELSSLPEGERAVAESQGGMTQDEVKNVCRSATLSKTGIFLTGRFELFTGGWVSWCWVPKRDDAENEKSNYKTDEGYRKGKYKHFVWSSLMYKTKFFSFSGKDLYNGSRSV